MSETITPYENTCFDKVIGLSLIDCACFDSNDGYTDSYSGLYLDNAEGLKLRMVDAVKDCSNENNLFEIMERAKNMAVYEFISNANSELMKKFMLARSNYYGIVGKLKYKNNRVIQNTYAGVRFATANVAGGYAHIKNITTLFSVAGNFTLKIYNNLNEQVGVDINLLCVNGRQNNAVDITLPLWDIRIPNLEYFFIYTVDAANPCKDNDVNCNCGGVYYNFNTNQPYYKSSNNKLEGWAKFLMAGEWSGNDLISFDECEGLASNYMNGLSFTIDLYCDLGMQFCFETPDKKDPNFMTVAFAILHKAAEKLIIEILTSTNVSRYTMLNGETLQQLITFHSDKYKECMAWLIENTNTANTDCLACRDKIKIGVGVL